MNRVTVLVDFFEPGYAGGGPIRSIANLTELLREQQFCIVTRDRDLGAVAPYPLSARWGNERVAVTYLDATSIRFWVEMSKKLWEARHEVVYLNSLFSLKFAIFPLIVLSMPGLRDATVILAPRGELSEGALSLKAAKKKWFLRLVGPCFARRISIFHATSEPEREFIQSMYPQADVRIVGNLPSPPRSPARNSARAEGAPLRFVYLGRVSPKKNVHRTIEAFRGVPGAHTLTVCGPTSDAVYFAKCKSAAEGDPRITFHPGVAHSEVANYLEGFDGFLHPSLDENFGHSIFEALSAGLPVVIGPGGPWRHLDGVAGLVVNPRSVGSITEAIQWLAARSGKEYEHLISRARQQAADYFDSLELSPYYALFGSPPSRTAQA